MHTIRLRSENIWEVIFMTNDTITPIDINLSKHEAMKLCNYLNGGAGVAMGESLPIDVVGH